jgi:hypothetical protein
MWVFWFEVVKRWRRILNRRSQQRRRTWARMIKLATDYLPKPLVPPRKAARLVDVPLGTITTLTVNVNNVGQVLAGNGVLQAIRFMKPPARTGSCHIDGIISLTETGIPNCLPKALFHVDIARSWYTPFHPIYSNEMLTHGSIAFVELTIARCPAGVEFEIDIA